MIPPLQKRKRKNPVVRTPLPLLPPGARSRAALGLTAAAALGRFELQVCGACGAVQYPPREACHRCLSGTLRWRRQSGAGELIAETAVHHSNDLYFRERVPWRLGLVRLDAGPTAVVHLHGGCTPAPSRVRVGARLDKSGQGVLLAFPIDEVPNMADDRQLREMTCDPKFRKVLVTDGKTEVGQALVRALIGADADLVWVGYAEPWKKSPGFAALEALPQVALLPLDVTDSRSVSEIAAAIGGKVDILINSAEVHRTHGIASRKGVETARSEMDVNYFGLLRLAQEFGPVMRSRGADGESSATAWVNLLSVYALSNFPPHGTFSASKAAALSLSQCLRAEMRAGGVRVINVFPGPIDDEWNQSLPPPKLTAGALARAVVNALKDGVEDIYPGDVAQEWLARWQENPKILEREIGT
ncbi:MAG TPA: SDR family NAD(P)-dependent oxidoreductase [Steroidobacteraceae bacterium]|jgi:NAD(P)-dependent dehydrogenase (short-subunit alcohol dehydrogenase family)/uncharacterized OB-fold protein|nr:SDR family NAD(P)-dependent oxidoreductase [Steroidobacteraceae bacterium]